MPDRHLWSELAAGDEFAGYRVERRLGRGGMGILYLALEPGLERRVALKLIAPEAAAEDVFARRFAEESRIAASIEHPNVVPIYAAGEEDGVPWIAMRFVSGSDLAVRIVRDRHLEPGHAVRLIAQVGDGLDAIHAAGLVHRDVKPANVLLSGGEGAEHAYITDFGVARNVATQSGLTQTGRFVGTLDYVAPEQIAGGSVDARVDVYALGCLLFKALTGEVPFPREAEAARLYAHLNDPPPLPSSLVPGVTMALDDVVARALAKEPGDRYPSAGDLGRAAEAAVRGGTVAIPERTVATGAAATAETATPPPSPPTRESEPTREAAPPEPEHHAEAKTSAEAAAAATAATRRDREPPPPSDPRRGEGGRTGGGRRPLLLGAGALALVAAVVVAIVLATGGGESGNPPAGADTTVAQTEASGEQTTEKSGEKTQPQEKAREKKQPQTLTARQLIAQGDAICEGSQESFKADHAEFPLGEDEPDPTYSKRLVGISKHAVAELRALDPPASLRGAYLAYLKAQEEVAGWDRDALAAAEAGDATAYAEARATRDDTAAERTTLAEAVGFHVCSGSNA
jgi:serine/threonine protein kinase